MTDANESNNKVAISIRKLGKMYKIYEKPSQFLKELIFSINSHKEFWALKNVTFEIKTGEVVGIIGSNGAGKSTLLKILAGTLSKTEGEIKINGKISAILELGTGFHPDYSGRQNIIMGCLCAGMSQEMINSKISSIIDFSELHSVIDQPFKTYSSGMQARLTFATAISISPDILIIDEALAAGDAYFSSKCSRRIREICNSGVTVLFVSHNSYQIAQLCDRAIWIENGEIRDIGVAREISRKYDYEVHLKISGGKGFLKNFKHQDPINKIERKDSIDVEKKELNNQECTIYRCGPPTIVRVEFLNEKEEETSIFRTWETLIIRVWYKCEVSIQETTLGLAIGIEREKDLNLVCQFSTCNIFSDKEIEDYSSAQYRKFAGKEGYIQAKINKIQLLEGKYVVSLGLIPNVPCSTEFYEYHHRVYDLNIQRDGFPSGAIFYPNVTWEHYKDSVIEETQLEMESASE